MPTTSSSQNVPDRAATLWQPETEHRQPRYLHMSTDSKSSDAPEAQNNARKDPDAWVTGDESMTGAQAPYLKTLCDEAGEASTLASLRRKRRSTSTSCRRRRGA